MSPETVAAYGEARPSAKDTIAVPAALSRDSAGSTSSSRQRRWSGSAKGRVISSNTRRMRRTTRLAPLRCSWRLTSATPFTCPESTRKISEALADDAHRAREVPVSERRFCLLAGRLFLHVAVPHRIHSSRLQPGGVAQVRPRPGRRRTCLQVPRAGVGGARPAGSGVVARLHGVANLRGEGLGRGRTHSGFEHQPALSAARSHAGVRDVVSARRADREERNRRRRASTSSTGG